MDYPAETELPRTNAEIGDRYFEAVKGEKNNEAYEAARDSIADFGINLRIYLGTKGSVEFRKLRIPNVGEYAMPILEDVIRVSPDRAKALDHERFLEEFELNV